jgi:hypothetical protein
MGLRVAGIRMVNCGRTPYRVEGFPVVHPLDDRLALLAVKVLDGTTPITGPIEGMDGPPEPVVLQPGQAASATVAWRNTYNDTTHQPVEVPYLEVTPAEGDPPQVIAADHPLDLGSTGRLGIGPWRAAQHPE